MEYLKVHDWEHWQTYRKDRPAPAWIKLYRDLLRNVKWVSLTDAQRAHLVSIWLLAGDHNGTIPADPSVVRKLCHLDSEPSLQLFVDMGFLVGRLPDGNQMVTKPRQMVGSEESRGEERREEKKEATPPARSDAPASSSPPFICIPTCRGTEHPISMDLVEEFSAAYPAVDVPQELASARAWCLANPSKRKTPQGVTRFLNGWLSRVQNRGGSGKNGHEPPDLTPEQEIAYNRAMEEANELQRRNLERARLRSVR